jgi:hypothetical protein
LQYETRWERVLFVAQDSRSNESRILKSAVIAKARAAERLIT